MKILFVNQYCGHHGGVEQNIADLASGLTDRGHQCLLAYQHEAKHGVDAYKNIFDTSVECLDDQGMTDSPDRIEELLNEKPDVIFVHKLDTVKPLTDHLDKLENRPRIVRMIHDHDLCCPRHHKYFAFSNKICHKAAGLRCWFDLAFFGRNRQGVRRFRFGILKKLREELTRNKSFDQLLVAGEFMRNELMLNGIEASQIRIIPPVVRTPSINPTPVSKSPNILFVGQMIRGKGVHLLIESLRKIKVPFSAKLVGDGVWKNHIQDLVNKYSLQDKVTIEGWKSPEKLAEYYRDSRVVVVPSIWPEPFGMVGLEAMHHGRPVVAFDSGGICEWLDDHHTGRLVETGDINLFARALEPFLTNIDYAERLGEEGRRQVKTRFSFERYLDQIEAILTNPGDQPPPKERPLPILAGAENIDNQADL